MSHRSLHEAGPLMLLLVLLLVSALAAEENVTLILPKGDPVAGRQVFLDMSCVSCHRIQGDKGIGLPDPVSAHPGPTLGGYTARQQTEQVALSIFDPSHDISGTIRGGREDDLSPMPDFSNAMTVRQFLDLIAFIRSLGE